MNMHIGSNNTGIAIKFSEFLVCCCRCHKEVSVNKGEVGERLTDKVNVYFCPECYSNMLNRYEANEGSCYKFRDKEMGLY